MILKEEFNKTLKGAIFLIVSCLILLGYVFLVILFPYTLLIPVIIIFLSLSRMIGETI